MYADFNNHLRDPFVSNEEARDGWYAPHHLDFNRALTPPPDMNTVYPTSKSGHHQQEHGQQHYGDYMPSQQTYRATAAPFVPREVSNSEFGRSGVPAQASGRPLSPMPSRQATVDDTFQQSQQHRASQTNAIAPSFQIPKSVNDSGGSLSELAAQITCLFWFESSDLLQQIEDAELPLQPPRQLVSDAKPTTGFRKWVTTILSTTLVAQNVVLLALLFVYRLKKLNSTVRGKPGSEYRLLTVALMLGNKFLDDNTYTNKTWAEVSGINVTEVHIMEVEFLSNMKYCLYTTSEDWAKWQSLLGKFAAFIELASKPQPPHPPPQILPPASSLYLPPALPSPPASNQASPPYLAEPAQFGSPYNVCGQPGPTPGPSPLAFVSNSAAHYQNSRKRSIDDSSTEPPPKRLAGAYQEFQSPHHSVTGAAQGGQSQHASHLTLPSLSMPPLQSSAGSHTQGTSQAQQLPPLNVPARAMAMVYPNTGPSAKIPQISSLIGSSSQPQSQNQSRYQSRQQSPYPGSANASPTSGVLPSDHHFSSAAAQISPTYFLQQRNSPYRPVHNVSKLLYPPPSGALQHQSQSIEYSQMHYQPLGKPIQQRQTGRLPYVHQNVWLDGNQQQAMTPVHQWPFFMDSQPQQRLIPQQ